VAAPSLAQTWCFFSPPLVSIPPHLANQGQPAHRDPQPPQDHLQTVFDSRDEIVPRYPANGRRIHPNRLIFTHSYPSNPRANPLTELTLPFPRSPAIRIGIDSTDPEFAASAIPDTAYVVVQGRVRATPDLDSCGGKNTYNRHHRQPVTSAPRRSSRDSYEVKPHPEQKP